MPIALLGGLFGLAYASVLSYLTIYAQEKGLLALTSTFFIVFAAVMLLTRPITGRLFDEKGPQYVLIPGFLTFAIGLILLAYVNSAILFLIAGGFIGFGYGALFTSFQTLAVQSTTPGRSGYATATYFTFYDSGLALGSYVLGIIAIQFGYQNVYLMAAVLAIFVFAMYIIIKRKREKKDLAAINH